MGSSNFYSIILLNFDNIILFHFDVDIILYYFRSSRNYGIFFLFFIIVIVVVINFDDGRFRSSTWISCKIDNGLFFFIFFLSIIRFVYMIFKILWVLEIVPKSEFSLFDFKRYCSSHQTSRSIEGLIDDFNLSRF